MTKPRAPADSPCELLPCAFCGYPPSSWEHISRGTLVTCFNDGCPAHGNTVSPKAWNTRAAPPVLSARPNEAEEAIRRVESNYPESVFPEGGTSIDCQSASMARLTCRNIRYELKRVVDERDENEADAPRGQALDGWTVLPDIPTADMITAGQDCSNPYSLYSIWSAMRLAAPKPPPSTVGEDAPASSSAMQADGVREKYRAVTLEDMDKLFPGRPRLASEVSDYLQSIGAVVPQEGK